LILVDTSVWIDHLRRGNAVLAAMLERTEVCCHPFVIGEISLGSLRRRDDVLALLSELPSLPLVSHEDVLALVSRLGLDGSAVGWIDAHLVASAIAGRTRLWTLDRPLSRAARAADIAIDL